MEDDHALNLTHFWPKNIPRIKTQEPEESSHRDLDSSFSYLTSGLKLMMHHELDFMPCSVITSQVFYAAVYYFQLLNIDENFKTISSKFVVDCEKIFSFSFINHF